MNKVAIIGTGKVGAACAQALALRGSCEELLLIDSDSSLAAAQASDLAQSAALLGDVRIESGNYHMLGGTKVVIIAAGKRQLEGSNSTLVLEENRRMLLEVVPQIVKHAPHAVIVVASQPVDALTQFVVNIVGQARANQVIGVGTLLETATLRSSVASKLGLHPRNIHGSVIGEEGVLGAVLWSSVNVAGVPLLEYLQNKNIPWNMLDQQEITDQVKHQSIRAARVKGSPCYGVGAAAARVTEAILKNTHEVLTVSAFTPHYGVSMSLPRVVGRQGIAETIWPTLDEHEQHGLELVLQVLRRMQVEGEVRG
jgi:L-lactate dehydrogenase